MEDFNQLLLDLAASQNYVEQPEEDDVSFPDDNEYMEKENDFDMDELLSENEELKSKLKEYEELQQVSDTQQEYYDYMMSQDMDDPNYAMNIVMADDLFEGLKDNSTSTATWLKRKDESVNISGLSNRILSYLETLPEGIRNKLLATSGNDSDVHAPGSKHYKGGALDLRFDKDVYNYLKNDPNFKNSGLRTLDPNHGTAPHIHIEEYKMGGKYKVKC